MRRYLIIGAAVYLVYLIATFPAQLALHWFAPEGVRAYSVEGPIWKGRAQALTAGSLTVGETSWDLNSGWLLTGTLSADVRTQLGDSLVRTTVSRSLFGGTVKFKSLQGIVYLADVPDDLLRQLAAGVQSVEGQLGVSFARLHVTEGWPTDAAGSLDLVDLVLTTPFGSANVGSFEAIFDGEPDESGALVGRLGDTAGPLGLEGSLLLNPDRSYSLNALANAHPEAPADISNALALLGTADPTGGTRLEISGTAPPAGGN